MGRVLRTAEFCHLTFVSPVDRPTHGPVDAAFGFIGPLDAVSYRTMHGCLEHSCSLVWMVKGITGWL
jgi:hypothetical protein